MAHVSIIGTGNMGQAIAGLVTARAATPSSCSTQSDADKPVTGDIVVLAVPYPAVADVLAQRGDQLAGKVVVDITNPLNFETFDSLVVPADGSADRRDRRRAAPVARAQGVQHQLRRHPGLRHGRRAPTTVLIAGDDADAKALLAGDRHRRRPARRRRRRAARGPASSRRSASSRSPSPPPRRSPGPAASAVVP